MSSINCPNCNKDISDKVKFCSYCGYPLIETSKKILQNLKIHNDNKLLGTKTKEESEAKPQKEDMKIQGTRISPQASEYMGEMLNSAVKVDDIDKCILLIEIGADVNNSR